MLQLSGMSSPWPARSKNTFKETRDCLSAAHFISNGNIAYPCGTKRPSYSFLETPPPSYSSFHLSFLSVQTAWNAGANIVLVTQPLTKTGGWLWLFFLCTVEGCSVVLQWGWMKGLETVFAMSHHSISPFQTELRKSPWSVSEGSQFALNWGVSVKAYRLGF